MDDVDGNSTSPSSRASDLAAWNTCKVCSRSFKRQEHLTRHMTSHTKEKRFGCQICGKHFSRPDVLHRHEQCHLQGLADLPVVSQSQRACKECIVGRVRCSRGNPCSRCAARNLVCEYPPPTKRRKRNNSSKPQLGDGGVGDTIKVSVPCSVPVAADVGPAPLQRLTHGPGLDLGFTGGQLADRFVNTVPSPSARLQHEAPPLSHMPAQTPWLANLEFVGDSQPEWNPIYPDSTASADQFNMAPLSYINWMSPPYQDSFDWDSQAAPQLGNYDDAISDPVGYPFLLTTTTTGTVPDAPDHINMPTTGLVDGPRDAERTSQFSAPRSGVFDRSSPMDRGGPTPGLASPASAPSEMPSSSTCSSIGAFYIDGEGFRAPFRGLSRRRHSDMRGTSLGTGMSGSRPDLAADAQVLGTIQDDAASDSPRIPTNEAYHTLLENIRMECQRLSIDGDVSAFPRPPHLRAFVRMYFVKFHPVFPIVQHSHLHPGEIHWLLLLAMAAVGASYVTGQEVVGPRRVLSRLLWSITMRKSREAVFDDLPTSRSYTSSATQLSIMQAYLLSICSMMSSEDRQIRGISELRYSVVDGFHDLGLFATSSSALDHDETEGIDAGSGVVSWIRRQSELRSVFMLWLLDSMLMYQFGLKPLLQLGDVNLPLPASESLWEKPSSEVLERRSHGNVTLLEALDMLYMEKKSPPDVSEFGNTILIYSILRRTREAFMQGQSELTSWTPSAKVARRTKMPQTTPAEETWPPATPLLSKWRNSACDCLDIIHWRANSKAAAHAGWEHPTILHLHLSRILLLAPITHIQTLARATSTSRTMAPEGMNKYMSARRHVLSWATRDQFKARLSIIHASALFWHVRRYSVDVPIEPFGIYLATLVMWAYSTAVQAVVQTPGRSRPQTAELQPRLDADVKMSSANDMETNSTPTAAFSPAGLGEQSALQTSSASRPGSEVPPEDRAEDSDEPNHAFVLLDRPVDDEMVQTYVRCGYRMAGHLLRVGDIRAAGAPAKILREGIRLLAAGPENAEQASSSSCDGADSATHGPELAFGRTLQQLLEGLRQRGGAEV